MSSVIPNTLTTCFLDTILVPLCTWIYLFVLVVMIVSYYFLDRHTATYPNSRFAARLGKASIPVTISTTEVAPSQSDEKGDHSHLPGQPATQSGRKKRGLYIAGLILYFFLIVANMAMLALQLARLDIAKLGVGMLPFTFATLLIAGALRFTNGGQNTFLGWRWLNFAVFLLLVVMCSVKIAEENKGKAVWNLAKSDGNTTMMPENGQEYYNGPKGRGLEGKQYPVSDEVTDVATMVGVYAVLAVLELVLSPRRVQELGVSGYDFGKRKNWWG